MKCARSARPDRLFFSTALRINISHIIVIINVSRSSTRGGPAYSEDGNSVVEPLRAIAAKFLNKSRCLLE